jgi:hypothetical protein
MSGYWALKSPPPGRPVDKPGASGAGHQSISLVDVPCATRLRRSLGDGSRTHDGVVHNQHCHRSQNRNQ